MHYLSGKHNVYRFHVTQGARGFQAVRSCLVLESASKMFLFFSSSSSFSLQCHLENNYHLVWVILIFASISIGKSAHMSYTDIKKSIHPPTQ